MASTANPAVTPRKTIVFLQVATLAWMLIECFIALLAAWKARSVSLLAFGSDSLVELISAAVVLLQFTPRFRISQFSAARFCGVLLYVLAVVVSAIAVAGLVRSTAAETSPLGIAVTAGALVLMPLLARWKRAAAAQTGDGALRADAVQSAACAYLAAITLAGLLLRSAFGLRWFDQAAALMAVPVLILEARRARRGHACGCA